MDQLQIAVHEYLDGKKNEETGVTERTLVSKIGRLSFFFLIMANVIAVIVESIPEVDRFIGNEPGNFFDVFEDISVLFFTLGESYTCIFATSSCLQSTPSQPN
jgi:hypothetical protein